MTVMLVVNSLMAQDIIVKKDGEEISAKILEIGLDNVKFKKYNNLEGPDYILPKYDIVFVKFENGTKEIFNQEKTSKSNEEKIRKGIHLGLHVAPGLGELSQANTAFGFSYKGGMDINIYFNDYIGIKTGFSYLDIGWKLEVPGYQYNGNIWVEVTSGYKGKITSFGVPFKLVVTSGKKFGIYMEFGLSAYFILSANYDGPDNTIYNNGFFITNGNGKIDLNHEPVILTEESLIGINYRSSKNLSFNLGVANNFSLTNNFPNNNTSKTVFIGLQFGMLFNLPN